jgi:hypothetical protein
MARKNIISISGFIIGLILIFLIYSALLNSLPLSRRDGEVLIGISESTMMGESYKGEITPRLSKKSPLFVSVYQNKTRVACLGYTKQYFPLHQSVELLSRGIELDAYSDQEIVITIFGDYSEFRKYDELPNNRGLLVIKDGSEGVVLPQTFKEKGLSIDDGLNLAAQKAGYREFDWDEFEVFTFEAQIIRSADSNFQT